MKVVKRTVYFIFSLIFAIGISGGGKEAASVDTKSETQASGGAEDILEDDGVYLSKVEKKSRGNDKAGYVRFCCQKGNLSYYIASVYDEEEQLSKDYVRVIDSVTGEQTQEDTEIRLFEEENVYMSNLTVVGDDYIVLASTYGLDGQKNYVARMAKDGTVKAETCLSDFPEMTEDTYIYNGMTNDGVNTYIPLTDALIVLDENLKYKKTLTNEDYPNICMGGDGKLYFATGYNGKVSSYDPETDKVTDEVFRASSSSSTYLYPGRDDELLVASTSSLKSYNIKSGTITKLFDFLDVNVDSNSFDTIFRSEDDDIHILFSEFERSTEEYEGEMIEVTVAVPYEAVVKRYEPGSVPDIDELMLACFYANPDIKTIVKEFNMAHPDIRAKIKCYSDDYSDYQAMQEAFNRDLINGEKFDVILFSYQDGSDYIEKGLFENLMDYISGDSSFDDDEFYENILYADKDGDKLYFITSVASIDGFIGLSEVFGDKEKLSFDDLLKAREEYPNIPFISNYNYDTIFFSTMLRGDYRVFLGGKEGEYNFDTDEFRKLCELSATFQKTPDSAVYFTSGYDGFLDGSNVIGRTNYFSTDSYLMARAGAGKNVRSYGGPSIDGNGYLLNIADKYAISSQSSHKEEAWELVKCLLKSIPDYSNGFRAYKKAFKADIESLRSRCKNGMTVVMDNIKYELYMQDGDDAFLEKMVENATVTKGIDEKVMEIVYEEIKPYFAKEKSLDEVINVMQKRVNLYIEEKK